MTSRGRFARQLNGRGYFGVVEVEIDPNSSITSIAVQTHGEGFTSQGYIESVPERGYESWKQGVVLGVAFALWTAGHPGCAVVITNIEGLTSDTNPTTIAAAAMDAVWKALAFTPEPGLTTQVEQSVVASQSLPFDCVCIPW
jgi:hypothetical protein